MKKIMTVGLVIVLLCVAISFVSEQWWFNRDKFETYQVPIKIGDNTFSFQRNYLWNYKKEDRGQENGYAHIRVLLPNFSPISKENYEQFKKVGPDINVSIFYNEDTDKKSSRLFQKKLKDNFDNIVKLYCDGKAVLISKAELPKGLNVYSCKNEEMYTDENNNFIFKCDNQKDWPNPQCKNLGNEFSLYGNLGFSFYFESQYAYKSLEIYDFVKNLIETAKHKGEK